MESDEIWAAVVATEDAYGEDAESHARQKAEKALGKGDAALEEFWQAVANQLHTLHAINRTSARPRRALLPGAFKDEEGSALS